MTDVLDQRLKPSPDAFFNAVGDETVLLQVRRGVYYGLDPMGTLIWTGMVEGRETREIIADIARDFDVPAAQVEEDASRFLTDLLDNEILVAS